MDENNFLINKLDEEYQPNSMLVFYKSNSDAYVEFREIQNGNVCNGHPLSLKVAKKLFKAVNNQLDNNAYGFLSQNDIYIDIEKKILCWYINSLEKELSFKTEPDGEIVKIKTKLPSILFLLKDDNLYVASFVNKSKSLLSTKLYYAPFPNVYQNCSICSGNVSFKTNKKDIESIKKEVEYKYFNSIFTHFLFNTINISKEQSYLEEYKKPITKDILIPLDLTIKEFVNEKALLK